MRRRMLWTVVLGATLLVSGSCGGGGSGGGSGGVTVADLAGGWFGPTGTTSPGAAPVGSGTGGMLADASGNAAEQLDGADTGATIAFSLYSERFRQFTFTTSDGRNGLAMLSADRNHLLYVDNTLRIGAWQRNAAALAPAYAITDIRDSSWGGVLTDVSPSLVPEDSFDLPANIFADDTFQAGNASTNLQPLTLADPVNGQFLGDFITTEMPADQGTILMLLTPDKRFLGVMASGGPGFPQDSAFGAWQR